MRRLGGLLLPGWVAITIGDHIVSWRPLTGPESAHELEHVRQWRAFGPRFAARYIRASVRAWRAGGDPYRDNAFEMAARRAAARSAQVALDGVDILEPLQP
jgi:hypothetical protein